MKPLLDLDPAEVRRARSRPARPAPPVVRLARSHTTVSVERATLRLAGLAGADHERVPWVNHLVDQVRGQVGLEHGVTTPVFDALGEAEDLLTLAQKAASGSVSFRLPEGRRPPARGRSRAARWPRHTDHRPAASRPRAPRQAARRPEAAAVDLPHRRHRRHLRGHPAGPGGRPRGPTSSP